MLIVIPDGNIPLNSFNEDVLKVFEAELKQSVIPFVEKNYRLNQNRIRALAGLSMGEFKRSIQV
jgi:predicted alpha/beta superfamily hydrolase